MGRWVYKERELPDDRDPEKNILRIEIRERTLREKKWIVYHFVNGVPFCVRIAS